MARTACSFCAKTEELVSYLVIGPHGATICDECVRVCVDVQETGFGTQGDLLLVAIGELVTNDRFVSGLTGIISDAAVAIRGGVVRWAGPELAMPNRYRDLPTLDCEGRAVMPAFIDADTHILFGGEQGDAYRNLKAGNHRGDFAVEATSLSRQATAATPDHQLADEISLRLGRLLRHGTTSVVASAQYGCDPLAQHRLIELAVELGGQAVTDVISSFSLNTNEAEDLPNADYVELMGIPKSEALNRTIEHGMGIRFRPGDATFDPRLFSEFGMHCLLLDDNDTTIPVVDEVAQSGGVVVVTPVIERHGKSARMVWDRGATLAIATGCDSLERYIESMQVTVAAAVRAWGLSIEEAVWSATRGAALAIEANEKGWIGRGAVADLIVLDAPSPSHLAYRLGTNLVWWTIKNGTPIGRSGPSR
jgi:imidazolonepropionase